MRPYPDIPTLPRAQPRPVQVSIIIPFLNEREVLPLCHARLRQVLDTLGESLSLIHI